MRLRRFQLLCCVWMVLIGANAFAFSMSGTICHRPAAGTIPTRGDLFALGSTTNNINTKFEAHSTQNYRRNELTMRDRSCSYWFSVGDTVQVIEDVLKGPQNLKGRTGRVVETWEKCDVDPTCCCAEQVDTDMAVRVIFQDDDETEPTKNDETVESSEDDSAVFYYYFAEEELVKL